MYDVIICGGQVVTPLGIKELDIGIQDGKITALSEVGMCEEAVPRIDASGKYILPGGIDVHVHMNDLGAEEMEDWRHGSLAAAVGGITTVVDMPIDNVPSTTDSKSMRRKLERIRGNSYVDYLLWGGLTADNLEKLPGVLEEGAVGFKTFLIDSSGEDFGRTTDGVLLEAMKAAAKEDFPIMIHAENDELNQYYTEQYGTSTDWADWSKMHPESGELEAVAKCLVFAGITGARIHIAHVSSAKTADMIEAARRKGIRVTCETCPHYLIFTDQDYEEKGALLKCAPPVRDEKNRQRLWEALNDGRIDMISSDHSPSQGGKEYHWIKEAWAGIAGIQNTLLAMYSEGFCKGKISLEQVAAVCSANPAQMLGISRHKGSIEVGKDADLVILDPKKDTIFKRDQMKMKVRESVYENYHFRGRIERSFLRGREVTEGAPAGRYIRR